MKLNQPLPVGIRPYFGETVDTDTVAAAIDPVDLFIIPVLPGYDLPIDIDNANTFTPTGAGVTTRWLNWLFYVWPSITPDFAADTMRFAKGYFDDNGIFDRIYTK